MREQFNEKVQSVKTHIHENKAAYISGAVCLVVGAGGMAIIGANTKALVNVKPVQILTWKSKQTVEVFVEALGDPGNIIQDITTGTVYASQGQAARALGVHPARISEHLSGKLPNINGHTFKFLAKAGTPMP